MTAVKLALPIQLRKAGNRRVYYTALPHGYPVPRINTKDICIYRYYIYRYARLYITRYDTVWIHLQYCIALEARKQNGSHHVLTRFSSRLASVVLSSFFCLADRKCHFCSRRPIAKVVFSASPGKKIVYAPREQIKNASDHMFVTLGFGSGDNYM